MSIPAQRYRQIHLDFHTAAECGTLGERFNPDEFGDTLADANVNAINIFAKCHHGYSYYPTKVGTVHPGLSFDLLGQQIEALHKRDIRCPIYVSVMWDDLAAAENPGWVVVNEDGTARMRKPLSGEWGWSTMDVASPYRDYYLAQVEELLDLYDVDGLWADITFIVPNYSAWSQAQMRKAGVNIADSAAVMAYAADRMEDFYSDVTKLLHGRQPDAHVFYNGSVTPNMRRWTPYMGQIEIESLPTSEGVWGYLHYPFMARQARTLGLDFLGMTGRFHKSWADFGGLKTVDQLDYECGTIVGAGGKICVGDQLHPNGRLDPAVYRTIGKSFARIKSLEPWLEGAQWSAEAAILVTSPAGESNPGVGEYAPDVEGAGQMFLEVGLQFNIVDAQADFDRYSALVVADGTPAEATLLDKLRDYLAGGGKLIVSGSALLDADGHFALDEIPVEYMGPAPTLPSFLRFEPSLLQEELAADYDYVFYDQAYMVQPKAGAQPLGQLKRALFTRTWEHYTSHQHAPVGDDLGTPVMVRSSNVLYMAAPLFTGYKNHDYWAYRAAALAALRAFLPAPLIKLDGPGWVECTLHHQPEATEHAARTIVHITAYHPRRTLQPIQHVDQSALTASLRVRVKLEGAAPQRAYLAPDGTAVDFTVADGYVALVLPPVGAHTVVVLE
jgi:hypothetical protein